MSTDLITGPRAKDSFNDRLSLRTSAQVNKFPPINVEYSASFLLSQEKPDLCAICQETPSHSYHICANKHSLCGPCLIKLFESVVEGFKLVNQSQYNPSAPSWKAYAETEELSKCPLGRCSFPLDLNIEAQDEKQGSIPGCVHWLNYTSGQEIDAAACCFDKEFKTLYGKLEDGTIAYFPHVSSKIATTAIQMERQINGQISAKRVTQEENGRQIYLECSFGRLKSSFKEDPELVGSYLGQSIEAKIEKIDEETGVPCARLPNQIWIHFCGVEASIGETVSGYVCNEEMQNFLPILVYCTPYQVGQEIEFTVEAINPARASWRVLNDSICGWLNNGVRVEFIPNPSQGGSSSYQVGETVSGRIRKIHAPILEEEDRGPLIVLDCSPEDYFLEDSSSLSSSFSEEGSSSTSSDV